MGRKEMMEKAKRIYRPLDEFKEFMRSMQGFGDEDLKLPIPRIKEYILNSDEKSPLALFNETFQYAEKHWTATEQLPVHSEWHHFIVPGTLLTSMRNNGYSISDEDIEEGMKRGEKFAGGSCGFMGTCGGAYSVGIVGSIVKRTTPLHEDERGEIMKAVADTLSTISEIGRRCCKRSSYIAMEKAVGYLKENGYDLPLSRVECTYAPKNPMCYGVQCPYHPSRGAKSA